jgi:hypothetical protein
LTSYFNNDRFKREAKVFSSGRTTAVYEQCSSLLFKKFGETGDFQKSYSHYVPDILSKYKMLVFVFDLNLTFLVLVDNLIFVVVS